VHRAALSLAGAPLVPVERRDALLLRPLSGGAFFTPAPPIGAVSPIVGDLHPSDDTYAQRRSRWPQTRLLLFSQSGSTIVSAIDG
jgi:hypothetical protein